MFIDTSQFEFTARLESGWRDILQEMEDLESRELIPWPERHLYGQGWDAFGFYLLGERFDDNCARCPKTTRLLDSIPGLRSAGFSVLQPGARIEPHIGYSHALYVGHLALIVPEKCGIRVGRETYHWTPGRFMAFNDMIEHEAWNDDITRRVVLLIEFLRPGKTEVDLAMSPELAEALQQGAGKRQ
ncbi:MAG: aspartyl/asparaginyl beta-hydroxylase domain-containing protein [Alphaproteobacteria bacterium]|nr:aspartyl/asparaginyl beta-hydroxylase domain-containing protein [Alphaproteobacteria bacterium]